MKKLALAIAVWSMPCMLMAQIEVHDNGKVTIGGNSTNRPPTCQAYVYGKTNSDASFLVTHNNLVPWTQGIATQLSSSNTVSYEIHVNSNPGVYYVTGQGDIFYSGGWLMSDSSTKKNIRRLEDPLERLGKLNGYTYRKKNFMVAKGLEAVRPL